MENHKCHRIFGHLINFEINNILEFAKFVGLLGVAKASLARGSFRWLYCVLEEPHQFKDVEKQHFRLRWISGSIRRSEERWNQLPGTLIEEFQSETDRIQADPRNPRFFKVCQRPQENGEFFVLITVFNGMKYLEMFKNI